MEVVICDVNVMRNILYLELVEEEETRTLLVEVN